jgi:hypothetical protein
LHLVGYLYYWQMGFNSVFKGLKSFLQLNMCQELQIFFFFFMYSGAG